ncbi:hypothetical protein ACLOJK_013470 [Asimina triloba]
MLSLGSDEMLPIVGWALLGAIVMGAANCGWRRDRLLVRLVPSAAARSEVGDGIEEDELSSAEIKGAAACRRCSLPRKKMVRSSSSAGSRDGLLDLGRRMLLVAVMEKTLLDAAIIDEDDGGIGIGPSSPCFCLD